MQLTDSGGAYERRLMRRTHVGSYSRIWTGALLWCLSLATELFT